MAADTPLSPLSLPLAPAPPKRRSGATVALLAGSAVIHNAHRMGVTPLFGELRDRFHTDYAGVGTLFSA